MGMAQFVHCAEHGVKGPEEWKLDELRQASGELVDAFALHHLLHFLLLVMLARVSELQTLILAIDGANLRLDLLLQQRGLHSRIAQRKEPNVDDDGEQDDRPAP